MAGVKDGQLLAHPGFPLGMVNTSKETEIPRAESGAQLGVREAVNIVFSASGKPSTREGYRLLQLLSSAHSGWSDDYLDFGLLVDAGTLLAVDEDGATAPVASGLAPLPMSYVRINDGVYWSNGQQAGMVTLDREARRWSAPLPAGVPTLALGAGALDAGTYQVTLTLTDQWGRESGAPRAQQLEVPANGAIVLTDLPDAPAGGSVRLYLSSAGGASTSLRHAATLPAGTTTAILDAPARGRRLETLLLRPLPAGQLVAYGNGRHFVARGAEVLFSPPLRYGLYDAKKGRIAFNTRVDLMVFVGDGTPGAGLYVSDGKRTFFLAGANPMEATLQVVSGCGAIPGQVAFLPGDAFPELNTDQVLAVWLDRRGRPTVGLPGGVLFHPKPGDGAPVAAWDNADSAALFFSETPGDRRLIAALSGARPHAFAVRDALVTRVIRHDEDT